MKAQDSEGTGIVRGLARLRMRFGMLLIIAALTVVAIAVLTGLAPAPVARNATGSDGSLAAERRAEHAWLAERNYAIATARQRLPEWNESGMERSSVTSADPVAGSVDPAVQSVADYLRAHSSDTSYRAQSVPDAAVQSVLDYLHVHARVDMPTMPSQRNQRLLQLNESLFPSQPRFYAPCCDPTDGGQ